MDCVSLDISNIGGVGIGILDWSIKLGGRAGPKVALAQLILPGCNNPYLRCSPRYVEGILRLYVGYVEGTLTSKQY